VKVGRGRQAAANSSLAVAWREVAAAPSRTTDRQNFGARQSASPPARVFPCPPLGCGVGFFPPVPV